MKNVIEILNVNQVAKLVNFLKSNGLTLNEIEKIL